MLATCKNICSSLKLPEVGLKPNSEFHQQKQSSRLCRIVDCGWPLCRTNQKRVEDITVITVLSCGRYKRTKTQKVPNLDTSWIIFSEFPCYNSVDNSRMR